MRAVSTVDGIASVVNPNQGLADLKNVGFENIYIDLCCVCPAGFFEDLGKNNFKSNYATKAIENPECLDECALPFFDRAKQHNLSICLMKAPTLIWDTKRTDLNELIVQLTKESIKLCGKHKVKSLIVPPLFAGIDKKDLLRTNKDFYLSLSTLARENGVTIFLENQCRDCDGHLIRGLFTDGVDTSEFIDELNTSVGEEVFALAFNVGNANLACLNMYEYLMPLSHYVKAVLVSDNNGVDDVSLLPYTSIERSGPNTDWLNLVRGVRGIDFDGDVIVECSRTIMEVDPFVKPSLLTYVKQLTDYFIWQFDMERIVKRSGKRVLFGAGNMCRNYMLNYGKEYPPLYTCDNNSTRWGEVFEGLEIKNPEELKDLPDDITIFICNVYYREIEVQLREMGIKNPIEYFNDRYMSSFHFERLDMAQVK